MIPRSPVNGLQSTRILRTRNTGGFLASSQRVLMRGLMLVALMVVARNAPVRAQTPAAPVGSSIAERYDASARRIIEATMADNDAYRKLEELCVDIGNRLSGSPQLEKAIDWAIATFKKDGQDNVHREKVMVPHWVRGRESATLIKPRRVPLNILGLGGSVGTPPEGITAPVVVVADKDELDKLGADAKGKIVLFNKAMPPYDPEKGAGYGATVRYRSNGATYAAEYGAVAALVRSVTAHSLQTPHTGAMNYGDAEVKIPTAAVTVEEAELMARMYRRGIPMELTLKMEAKTLPDAQSANVLAELRGSTLPDEIVVMGGHFDSWDVGQGAHDDGGGCIIAMEAINVLRKLNMIPRRTIRVVFWVNEENGLRGGKDYAKTHADELDNHIAAIESDSGVFNPKGYSLGCDDKKREAVALSQMREIVSIITPRIEGITATLGWGGADIGPTREAGVIQMGHRVEGSKYFDFHHTPADTIDKVVPEELSRNVAVLATVAYILADMPERFGGPLNKEASGAKFTK